MTTSSTLPPEAPVPEGGALGVVVIGRNEGDRLKKCLGSVRSGADRVVYVDSGSTDGSADYARSLGVAVVELDMSRPFSAARARNSGFERLRLEAPGVRFVQFVDGDCELDPGWLGEARAALEAHEDWAVVCGRRRERFPDASLFNRLCDVEWDTPVGEASACGGDFLVKATVFEAVGGFDPTVVAGEEPELCHRIRGAGHRVFRLDREMTLHDVAMTRLGEWTKRVERAGYAFALVCALHFRSPRRVWVRQVASILLWALAIPLGVAVATWWFGAWGLVGLLVYPLLWWKTVRYLRRRRGLEPALARLYGLSCVAGKFLELRGVLRATRDLALRRPRHIIEYKRVGASP